MIKLTRFLPAAALAIATAADRPSFQRSEILNKLVNDAAASAADRFAAGGLTRDKIALTILDITDREKPARASYRGEEPTYPASVVKLFYLVAAEHQLRIRRPGSQSGTRTSAARHDYRFVERCHALCRGYADRHHGGARVERRGAR